MSPMNVTVSVLSRVEQSVAVRTHTYIHVCVAACGNESKAEACSYTDLSGSNGEGL